ncbi:MAG: hypothetical protein PHY12_06490 [Eubacteriales bacterium]|nr:hypothetical protein [Eubacteriales bacterium]
MTRRWIAFALTVSLCLLTLPAFAGNGYEDYKTTREVRRLLAETSNTRLIDVPGRGPTTYYAQTNPFWDRMRYEIAGSSTYRRFGEGGCCPTSAAIAFANLLTVEQLGAIRPYASKRASGGFGISTGVMNPLNMAKRNGVYWLDRAQDYYDLLPLVFGQFAAGNNSKGSIWRAKPKEWQVSKGGTNSGFIPKLAEIYGLTCTQLRGKDDMSFVEPVQNGATAVALANSQWHPFASGIGHYLAIVHVDDEYVYFFDPQDKTAYADDREGILEVVESGLVRVKLENFHGCHIGLIYVLSTPEIDAKIAEQS